jgi:hypothetical protein
MTATAVRKQAQVVVTWITYATDHEAATLVEKRALLIFVYDTKVFG